MEQPVAYITTAHADPAMRRREPGDPKLWHQFFTEKYINRAISMRTMLVIMN